MDKQKMSLPVLLLSVAMISASALLLNGCSTTPDESYKESQMTRPLDYPPDLVAPTINKRFSVPAPGLPAVSTPIILPETEPVRRKPSGQRGGQGGHSH
ncbi:MAG: hypothetical protein L3J89_13320 [Gammaproteobacteria bacterium]|nr:hypothetical protein [Gammaproteobacteria bacterium]